MSKILREYLTVEYDQKTLKEARDTNQPIILKTILQRAEVKNQNR